MTAIGYIILSCMPTEQWDRYKDGADGLTTYVEVIREEFPGDLKECEMILGYQAMYNCIACVRHDLPRHLGNYNGEEVEAELEE